jgi:hypothetical protein
METILYHWIYIFYRWTINISFAALQAHGIVNIALHWEYSPSIIFIFSQGTKDLYHV